MWPPHFPSSDTDQGKARNADSFFCAASLTVIFRGPLLTADRDSGSVMRRAAGPLVDRELPRQSTAAAKRVLDMGTASGFLTFEMENARAFRHDRRYAGEDRAASRHPATYRSARAAPPRHICLKNAYWFTQAAEFRRVRLLRRHLRSAGGRRVRRRRLRHDPSHLRDPSRPQLGTTVKDTIIIDR